MTQVNNTTNENNDEFLESMTRAGVKPLKK